MKFFIVLALVAVASANLNYGGSSFGGSVRKNFGVSSGYGSGLSSGFSGGYGSGLSVGGGSGLGLGGGYTAAGPAQLAIIQTVPGGSVGGLSGLSGGYSSGSSLGLSGGYSRGVSAGLGSSVGLGGSYGASLGGSYGGGASYGASSHVSGPVFAAVHSTRNVQYVDVGSTGEAATPAQIVIGPSIQPIDIEFQSQSSPVTIRQSHIPGQASEPQVSSHEEQPDILRQEIVKPVIHEVTEAIQPYRTITQEVRPVLETVNQLITRGEQRQVAVAGVNRGASLGANYGASGSYGGSYGGSSLGGSSLGVSSGNVGVSGGKALGLVAIQPITSVGGVSGGLGVSGLQAGGSYGGSALRGGYSSGSSFGTGSSLRSGSSYGGSLSGSTLVSKPSASFSSFGANSYRS